MNAIEIVDAFLHAYWHQQHERTLALATEDFLWLNMPYPKLRIEGLDLKADNLSSQLDQTSKLSLQATLNKNGKLSVTGQAAPQLKTVDLALDAQNLPIAPFQTYFTDYLNVTLQNSSGGPLIGLDRQPSDEPDTEDHREVDRDDYVVAQRTALRPPA